MITRPLGNIYKIGTWSLENENGGHTFRPLWDGASSSAVTFEVYIFLSLVNSRAFAQRNRWSVKRTVDVLAYSGSRTKPLPVSSAYLFVVYVHTEYFLRMQQLALSLRRKARISERLIHLRNVKPLILDRASLLHQEQSRLGNCSALHSTH